MNRVPRIVSFRLAPVLIVALGVFAYTNSFRGALVFDDFTSIGGLIDTRDWAGPGQGTHLQWTARPVTDLTFAANALLGGRVADYHLVNLLVHLAGALALYGVVRRTPRLGDGERTADALAFVTAATWVVHPLTTAAVTYVAQRYESLASLFALLTLYATARGATAERKKGWWYAAVVAACLLGMGSKESMITAPLLVLAYDWAYLSGGSWREMVRRRGGLYAGLLLAVAALAILMRCKLKAVDDAFYVWQGASPLRYLFTEAGVILRYLRLSIWPSGQCFDYAWPLAERAGEVLGPLLTVGCLGVLSLAGLARRKAWGFPATAFFILLAPSSSLIARPDPLVEHRVYLPLAAVLTLVWGGVVALCRSIFPARSRQATWRWVAGACLAAVLAALATATFRRNASFESAVALWSDVVAKRPENGRGWLSLSCSLLGDRRDAEAAEAARQALRRMVEFRQLRADVIRQADHRPSARNSLAWRAWYYAQAENCLGVALARQGREAEAIEHFDEALRLFPDAPSVYANRSLAVAASSGHSPSKKEQPRP